jgi:3-deoxy-manno-octulosonate cytidylyltransferase (CMP-KDO synthetase)
MATEKIVGFIPARAESSRFPGKPLADIAGKSMVMRVYERAISSGILDDLFVATDSQQIGLEVQRQGGKFILTASTHRSGTDRISEAAASINMKPSDIVVNIQGDQPLFEPVMIKEVVGPLLNSPEIPMSTLIYRIVRDEEITHPNAVKTVFDSEGFALYFSRSTVPYYRDAAIRPYYKHHGIYAYRYDFLQAFAKLPQGELESAEKLEQLRAIEHGYKIKTVLTEFDSIEVDTPEDLNRVRETYAKMI